MNRRDSLVEVDGEQLKGNTKMVPKGKVLVHVNNVVAVIRILPHQILEHLELHQRLMVEPLLVADNLDSVHPIGAEVVALEDLRMGKFGIGQVDV